MRKQFLFGAAVFFLQNAFALPEFTAQEVQWHQAQIRVVTSTAANCLENVYADHTTFFEKWKVSKYYGDRNPQLATRAQRRDQLRSFGVPESLEPELEPISCIGLTLRCLREGFRAAGQGATWEKISQFLMVDNKVYGTDLQAMLQKLGWKVLYWNPEPASNAKWDQEDRELNPLKPGKSWNPVWGGHVARYSAVIKKGQYFGIQVDDAETLVNFKTKVPQSFLDHPFFIGTAHAGYHVFPGSHGKVIEAHSMRKLNSFENLEVSLFNPLESGGGPRWTRTEQYRSGIIVVPPAPADAGRR